MKKVLALMAMSIFATAGAQGVILFRTGDPSANTTAPDTQIPHDGWDYEGTWGGFLGTPIAPHFFISAAHIGQAGGSTFTFQNINYSVVQGFYDPQSDLVIWQVTGTFPTFAPLYSRQDEVGQRTVDIGRGTWRGADYSLNNLPLGWLWGDQAGTQRWGENSLSSILHYGTNWDLLYATFDQSGLTDECTLSSGDSGGAAFINAGGVWKLAGINYAVDGPYSENADGSSPFNAALFDTRGLYTQDGSQWVQITGANPVPSGFYPTRISTKLAWICSVVAAPVVGLEGNLFTLTYTKFNIPEASYVVEQSTNLVTWGPATTSDQSLSTSGDTSVIKSTVDPGNAPAFFLRLRITQQ